MYAYLLAVIHTCPIGWLDAIPPTLSKTGAEIEQASSDLAFGCRQVDQFICDRPDAGKLIKRDPVLRMMLVWYFAGELNGDRVYWDYRRPVGGGQPADHLPRYWGYPALIRVSNDREISAIDKCTMLVFELLNSEVDKENELLNTSPPSKRKSRDEYAIACVRHEFEAGQKTRAFFLSHPLPNATFQNDPNYSSFVSSQITFSEYLSYLDTVDSKTFNPLKYYREGYDRRRR